MSKTRLKADNDVGAPPNFDAALKSFHVAKYRFHLIAAADINGLPEYKGSLFHGAFGHALKQISPHHYRLLHEPHADTSQSAGDIPKPFVLLPPLDTHRKYTAGQDFSCELTLFGQAIAHLSVCHAALDYLGRRMGLGPERSRFQVESVEAARPGNDASAPERPLESVITGLDIVRCQASLQDPLQDNSVTLHFPTRLRLKANGAFLREPPPFSLFTARLLGRLNTLAHFHGQGELVNREQRAALQAQADAIRIHHSDLRWQDWNRYSGRQKEHMKFGGLLGSITYEGKLQPFLPWLALGEWTHVGGKTSFGLGKYELS